MQECLTTHGAGTGISTLGGIKVCVPFTCILLAGFG